MQDASVTITPDRIFYTDKPTLIVMDVVSKHLMKIYSDIVCQNGGNVLDIGFGLGYSANYIYENVGNYTCIEVNPTIYESALKWAKDKPNVNIIYGDWVNIIPTMTQKFDGIFMDTYRDSNYSKFESYAKMISNENCCLSIYEYDKLVHPSLLNNELHIVNPMGYSKLANTAKKVSWRYYVAGEYRKDRFYNITKSVLSNDICNKIIADNKNNLKYHYDSAIVKGVEHTREFEACKLLPNEELYGLLSNKIFPEYDSIKWDNVLMILYKYTNDYHYDRHVETVKRMELNNPEQLMLTLDITLNNEYDGGDVDVYDMWNHSSFHVYSRVSPKMGDVITYKPYHHVRYNKVNSGVKYQLLAYVKNSDMSKSVTNLI